MKVNKQNSEFLRAYDEYSDAIFRFCLFKTRNRDLSLDITQETFMKTWEYLSGGEKREIENIRAFLYKVANNLIIDQSRKKKNFSLDEMVEYGFDYGFDEKEKTEEVIDGKKVIKVLDQIDDKYREVIIMHYVDDFSIKEIAKIIKETENNVSVRLHRGLKDIKSILREYEK
ncbi:hypothetical protein A2995_00700 [Candidatus Nomurabacteria bacterium RIFCSPLOWO2_01_FULL_33_24]|uniref:RNA polymerase sigma factor n=1 Tax=Candidatus Nomurabacteria bacterium RIFCSPLOWO2_01_FULL_33_24 TaxID=1801765 RepID=A0A1F6X103_9BACT|nr:MAG: hypothetical protein A2995_00700 [Candidatus Nomurabacteria bacterium RIFCSPLOWO2_01_FULL_33_24]